MTLGVIAAGSLFGVYEHASGNLDLAREVRPHAGTEEGVKAVLTGAAPLLAPGVLAVGALVGIAATVAAPHAGTRRTASDGVPAATYGAYPGRQPSP